MSCSFFPSMRGTGSSQNSSSKTDNHSSECFIPVIEISVIVHYGKKNTSLGKEDAWKIMLKWCYHWYLVKSVNSCSFFYLQISFFSATLLIYRLETGQTQSRTSSELRGVEPAWWYLPETLMSISPTICTPLHILFLIYFQALFTIYSSLLSLPFRGLSLKSSAGTKLMQVIKF